MRISVTPTAAQIAAARRVRAELRANLLTESSEICVIAQAIADAAEHAGAEAAGMHCHCSACVPTCNCSAHK